MSKKLFTWKIQVSIYRPRSSGHLATSHSLLEPSKFKDIWKFKISHEIWTFRIRYSHFARSCKILRWVVAACWNTFWTISHESAKFSLDHAKSTYTSSLTWNQFSLSGSFCTIMRFCNIWFLSFPLLFIPFLCFDSTLTTSN